MKKTITFSQLKSLVKEGIYPNLDPHYVGLQVAFDDLYEALCDSQSQVDACTAIEDFPVQDGTDEEYRKVLEEEVAPYVNGLKAKFDALMGMVCG